MGSGGIQLIGDKQLLKLFRELAPKVQRRVLRPAVNVATTPIVKAARSRAAKRSGMLRKSMGKKVKTYADHGTVVGIVGPRTAIKGEYKGKKVWPAKYAHLVEKGHIAADGSYVPPHPFLGPAYNDSQGQALGTMKDKLAEGVIKQAKAGAK